MVLKFERRPSPAPHLPSPDALREGALLARERILGRTIAGQDARREAFTPYARTYSTAKRSALYVVGGAR